MNQQTERERAEREMKETIIELAAGLLQVIAGIGRLHEVPRQIEEAASAMRKHVGDSGIALKPIAQALKVDAMTRAEGAERRLVVMEDTGRMSIEGVHEDALNEIRIGAVRETAALLEGDNVKAHEARHQILFWVDVLIDAQELRLERVRQRHLTH